MTVLAAQLSESLQALVDSRLDTIDRMLLGRVPRPDRVAIVKEVETQVFELLQERDAEELGRDDVLAVLARLDPPEAYLPEETGDEPVPGQLRSRTRVAQPVRRGDPKVAKASGILGILAMVLILLSPLDYLIAMAFGSEVVLFVLGALTICSTAIGSILGIALGAYARMSSAWAVVGVVTSVLALLLSLAAAIFLILAMY